MIEDDLRWESGDIGGSNDMGAKEEGSDLQDLPDDQDVVSNHPSEGEILTPS